MRFLALPTLALLAAVALSVVAAPEDPSVGEAHYQLQLLQEDVMALRGQVEQLNFQLEQAKARQDERYLELDGRLQQIMRQLNVQGGSVASQPVSRSSGKPANQSVASQSEKSLYDNTLQLIREEQFDVALEQLGTLIDQYPAGEYIANAYYWQGEVYAAKPEPNYEKARQSWVQVIRYFPGNAKVPDAEFKLGKVYHLMGDCMQSKQTLQQVADKYQGQSVAKLAETYMQESLACDP